MSYRISKTFTFDAAHHLPHLPDGHKCARPHGHTYTVCVELRSYDLNENGFVVDYGELDEFKRYIDEHLDHRDLNEVFDFPTTAENLAKHLFFWCTSRWPETFMVGVSETPKTWAWFLF